MSTLQEAAVKMKGWRENPSKFVFDNFQVTPDPWQAQALEHLARTDVKPRLSLQACVGPGKSAVLAWSGWYAMACRGGRGEHPKGAAVSITQDNLKDNLWAELSKWRERSTYLKSAFEWTKERVFAKDHPETWFLSARSWSKKANAEEQGRTLSGLHSEYVIILIDESGEIPVPVAKAGDQALSNCKWGRIIQAGNPTSHDGLLFAAATKLRGLWEVIRISGDPEDPEAWVHAPRVGSAPAAWSRSQIETYGRDNPWIMSSILGLFPPSSINALLGPDEVEEAMQRFVRLDQYEFSQKRLGVDVARFGNDRTIIAPRQGLVCFKCVEMRAARTHDIAGRVAMAKSSWGSEMECVDDTGGYGAGVIDALLQAGHSPIPVNFSSRAIDPRYFNKRSEMWFELANWVKRGGALPPDPELSAELTAPTYTFQQGKFRLEEKDQIKARLGFSPDKADAYALTFAYPDAPASEVINSRLPNALARTAHAADDWNPFDPNRA